ncbi:hypothetical protein ABDK56_07240 [Sphingomonas sp. ASV193]|uniref:PAS domain-containing protein n=1 Tax=Sphingomonas sp. ASV193 TaxID=3144405 RepID=UPI0032E89CB1
MDSYSHHPSDFDLPAPVDEPAPAAATAAAIGADERRMHVRAYNYWCSLLDGRDYPSIEDLDPTGVTDFGPHSVLLDFTGGGEDPATPYIGAAVRDECGLAADGVRRISDVPSRSLLSRLTDHYMQIIANRAPVGFEAEFVNQRGHTISYRGIMMPFSSDGQTIDFIYGVINWKDAGEGAVAEQAIVPALAPATDELVLDSEVRPIAAWDDEDASDDEEAVAVDDDAGLADRLCAARESAEVCKQADGRSRAALYRALAMAYDFSVAAKRVPDDYAEILDDAGVKAQARAPMTPVVKLVFGADYDKARLTEFAAALSFAEREGIDFGGFLPFVERAEGGLKGLVAAERKARRPAAPDAPDRLALGKVALRAAPAIDLRQLATNEEFALVVTRRNADGVHEAVRLVADPALLERLVRKLG